MEGQEEDWAIMFSEFNLFCSIGFYQIFFIIYFQFSPINFDFY